MIEKVKTIVKEYMKCNGGAFTEVRIVWFCKTLQNWKCLACTDAEDNLFFEISHNGDKNETYLDVYDKQENIVIKE